MPYSVEQIARVCHEATRQFDLLRPQGPLDADPGPVWDFLPAGERNEVIGRVRLTGNGATPAWLHQAWCEGRASDGYRFGPVLDVEDKTDPRLRVYDLLPEKHRARDALFTAIVRALIGAPADEHPVAAMKVRPEDIGRDAGDDGGGILIGPPTLVPAGPRVGDRVHYTSYGTPGGEYSQACRAAIITQVLPDSEIGQPVGLCVLNPEGLFLNPKITHDPGQVIAGEGDHLCGGVARAGGTWHWPLP